MNESRRCFHFHKDKRCTEESGHLSFHRFSDGTVQGRWTQARSRHSLGKAIEMSPTRRLEFWARLTDRLPKKGEAKTQPRVEMIQGEPVHKGADCVQNWWRGGGPSLTFNVTTHQCAGDPDVPNCVCRCGHHRCTGDSVDIAPANCSGWRQT